MNFKKPKQKCTKKKFYVKINSEKNIINEKYFTKKKNYNKTGLTEQFFFKYEMP